MANLPIGSVSSGCWTASRNHVVAHEPALRDDPAITRQKSLPEHALLIIGL